MYCTYKAQVKSVVIVKPNREVKFRELKMVLAFGVKQATVVQVMAGLMGLTAYHTILKVATDHSIMVVSGQWEFGKIMFFSF